MSSPRLCISIVVPVLNEARLLPGFLRHLRAIAPDAEIIVVDGGSGDDTRALAEHVADVVIIAPCGRATQMNAGAAVARGDVLWFLHADLTAPANAVPAIRDALADARIVGGCFRVRFPRRDFIYRVSDSLGNAAVALFGFALGDHGIFCRREAFQRAGTYPETPIMEDAEIYRRLRRVGGMKQLRAQIESSPRAYERHGPYRTTAVYFLILAAYVLGARLPTLHRIQRRFLARTIPAELQPEFAAASRP